MGKRTKEHRAKVAKRNRKIADEKGKMQRLFDKMLKEQMEKIQSGEELNVQLGDNPIDFSVLESNQNETNTTTETPIEVEVLNEVSTIKESVISEDEEQ